jgi:hypothetical protein
MKALKEALLILAWFAALMFLGKLDYEGALVTDAIRKDPPIALRMLHSPCETWIEQSGGGEPVPQTCVKASWQ